MEKVLRKTGDNFFLEIAQVESAPGQKTGTLIESAYLLTEPYEIIRENEQPTRTYYILTDGGKILEARFKDQEGRQTQEELDLRAEIKRCRGIGKEARTHLQGIRLTDYKEFVLT